MADDQNERIRRMETTAVFHAKFEPDPDLLSLLTIEDWAWIRERALAPAGLWMSAGRTVSSCG